MRIDREIIVTPPLTTLFALVAAVSNLANKFKHEGKGKKSEDDETGTLHDVSLSSKESVLECVLDKFIGQTSSPNIEASVSAITPRFPPPCVKLNLPSPALPLDDPAPQQRQPIQTHQESTGQDVPEAPTRLYGTVPDPPREDPLRPDGNTTIIVTHPPGSHHSGPDIPNPDPPRLALSSIDPPDPDPHLLDIYLILAPSYKDREHADNDRAEHENTESENSEDEGSCWNCCGCFSGGLSDVWKKCRACRVAWRILLGVVA